SSARASVERPASEIVRAKAVKKKERVRGCWSSRLIEFSLARLKALSRSLFSGGMVKAPLERTFRKARAQSTSARGDASALPMGPPRERDREEYDRWSRRASGRAPS